MPCSRCRPRKPKVVAQSLAFILRSIEAALLQFRHHQPNELLESAGLVGGTDGETICRALPEPVLQPVGDTMRRPDEIALVAAAVTLAEIAQGQPVAGGGFAHFLIVPLHPRH